jgi:hypothetical protein
MTKVDTKTPILHIFHQKCKKWCLGVLCIYTAIVFGKTPLDTIIYNYVSGYCLSKTPLDINTWFYYVLIKGGVYSD